MTNSNQQIEFRKSTAIVSNSYKLTKQQSSLVDDEFSNETRRIRLLGDRYDLPVETGVIISQTPQAGEFVDHGTVVEVDD